MLFLEVHMLETNSNTFQPIALNAAHILQMHAVQITSPPMIGTAILTPAGRLIVKNKYEIIRACLFSGDGKTFIQVPIESDLILNNGNQNGGGK